MPAIMKTPKHLDLDDLETSDVTHDVMCEEPLRRASHPGWWRRVTHGHCMRRARTPRVAHTAAYAHDVHPDEAPLDRCLREHPTLAPYIFAAI